MSKQAYDDTDEWLQYQSGIFYNGRIDLYNTVNKNERFYSNDQWNGVVSNGLPTPVFNIFKRIIDYKIAAILSQNTAMQFTAENVGDNPSNPEEQALVDAAELITQYSETLFEKLKMNQHMRQWLLDAALSGDACAYSFWDSTIDTMQALLGDINMDDIDSVNVMFGNPNDKRVQMQPYILIVFRDLVSKLKEEALANKIPQQMVDLISADFETMYQSGDRGKIEIDNGSKESGKCQAILKLWKVTTVKDGKTESVIMAKKCVRQTEIRKEWNTKLSLYPIAWMNWTQRKNSYHGQAEGTGLIPNQIFINKMFAMAMVSQMHTAFPKAIYNSNLIAAWDNVVGGAIGVNAGTDGNITSAAAYMNPGNFSDQVFKLIDSSIQYTKDMLGASDAALGDVKPENTSAIIAIQQAAAVPLETIKQNLYQFVEDNGYIWLDFMANNYGVRKVDIMVLGKRQVKEFDFSTLKKMKLRLKIDVGPSSYWSQISAMQTLDHLLEADRITFQQYLDRVPAGLIPKSKELIEDIKQQDIKQQFMWEQMARYMETLPPQVQQQLHQLDPDQMEQQVMQMMMQQQPQAQQQDPAAVQADQQMQQQQDQSHMDKQASFLASDQAHQQKLQLADKQHTQKVELAHIANFGKVQLAKLGQRNKAVKTGGKKN